MKRKPKTHKDRWERGFQALSRFCARQGHCFPSRRHLEGKYRLGQWVAVQRRGKDELSQERKRRLDALGFVWNGRDCLWEQGFAALLKYKEREGHCRVPGLHREGKYHLGWWIATQRRNRNEMSAVRKKRLKQIGFVWRSAKPR